MVDTIRRARAVRAALNVERDLYAVETATLKAITADLEAARMATIDRLSRASKDWQIGQAQDVLAEVERQMRAWEERAVRSVGGAFPTAAGLGADQALAALKAGGVEITSHPFIPTSIVATAYQSLPHLIADVRADTIAKVGRVLRQSVLGQQTPLDAMKQVGRIVGPTAKGPFRNAALRGEMIVRTELGRIAQQANYATTSQLAAHPVNAGMMSEWVAVSDMRTRSSHARVNGQRVPVGKAFSVNGHDALYPHDPRLPAGESIGCRCISIPWHPDFEDASGILHVT